MSRFLRNIRALLPLRPNCVVATLNLLHETGGYGAFRGSDHSDWGLHALHIGPQGVSNFAPGATLDKPSMALFGFDGVWWTQDMADPRPVSVKAIVISSWIFALTASFWGARKLGRKVWRYIL